jgi:hypothetical protein
MHRRGRRTGTHGLTAGGAEIVRRLPLLAVERDRRGLRARYPVA